VQSILPSAAVSIGNSLAQGASTEAQYQITGYVSALAGKPTDYSRYGNQNFWITNYSGDFSMSNANGAFYVFNGVASQAVKVGDYVTLTTTIANYNGVIESSSKRAVTILQEAPTAEPISPFVLDLTSFSDLGYWQIENATFNSLDGNKYIYDVGSVVAGTSYIGYFPNVRFEIANTKGKTDAFRVSPGKYFEFSGKNGVVHVLNTQAGDIIRITCASKGSTPANFNDTVENIYPYNAYALSQDLILPAKNSEGADADGYVWRTLEWQSTGGDVSIKEIAGGFRIREIEVAKSNVEPGQNITVKLRTNGYWQNVYLYAWTDSYEQLLGSWPGTKIYQGTDTFYTYTFENLQDNLNIIWNNGDGAQTADLAVADNTCYVLQNNSGAVAVLEDCILTPEPELLRPKNGDIWPIWLTGQAMAQAQAQNSLVYDFSNNSVDRNFYIWENTYTTSGDYGYNSYGEYQWYYTLTVGSDGWAGAGLSLRGSDALTAANQLRRAIVADPEHFYLHIAVKASDNYSHAFNIFDSEYTRFTLGRSGIYESPVYGNFQRDGQWHEFNIPLAQYAEALSSITLGENGNIFTVLSEGVQGATINLDAIYFYYSNSETPQPTAPTPNDLTAAGYNLDSDVVLCVKFTEDATVCNDIYFVGSFSGWESSFTGCPKFNELQGFEGWYVASQPYSAEFGGKPIQARSDGSFTWNNQCGDAGAWTYVNGYQAYIENGYSGESNVSFYYPGPYIYEMSYWKDHVDPCVNDTMYQVVVRLVAPQNPPTAGVEIIGTFDNWDGTMMTRNGNTYTATVTAAVNDQFKFREAYDTSWNNEILYLNEEDGYWSTLPDMAFSDFWSDLSEGVKQITLDFSNPSQFVWLANVMPQNLQAQLTSDAKLRVTWDAVSAASSYRVQIKSPQDNDLANAIEVTNNSYLSVALTMNGNYTVYVTALDAEGRAMAYRYIKVQVEVPSIPMVTIQGYAPTDCNMDVSNGLWLVWRPTGQEDWNTPIAMQRQNAHSFTVSFAPNAPSYDYYFINRSSVDAEDVTSSYYWEGRTEATHCSEILYARTGDEHGLRMVGDCQFQDHNYAITNPQATVAAGRVDFSWTALGDIAESYTIYICDTAWSVQEYITVHNATSYSWGVSDEWDGQQICWAVRPEEPYQHAYAFGSDILTLQKSSIELVNLNMSLSNDQKALNLSWNYNSTNLHYLVEITIDGVVVKRQIVTSNNYVYTAPFDTWYSAYITPLNLNNEVVGSRAYAGDPLRATGAPEPYTNMQGVATGRHIDFTWQTQISQSRAIVVCQLSNGDRHFVLQTDVQQNTLAVDVEADGEYYLYLEPYLEYETGKLVLVERWWNTSVQVYSSTTTTFPVNITAGAGGYLSNGNINAQYAEGTTLYVYANPNEGYYFAGWSDGEQSSSRTIYVDHAITLQANFARAAAVTLVNMPHGTVNIDGEFVDVYNNVYYFKPGTQITLEAVADEGYRFLQWWDGNKAQPRTLTVQGDMTISATFEAISPATPQYLVTITTSGTGNGTVDVPSGIYYQGDVITITATPAANSVFAGWTDGNTDNPRTVTVTGPMTLNAIFNIKPAEPTKYTVTFLNWDGTVLDSRLWEEGTTPSYSGATPTRPKSNDTIFVFAGWTPTIVPVTANATYTATYTATKEEVKYTITFKNWDDAILEAKQWKAGEMPSCSVTPTRQDSDNYAFVFAGWEPEIVAVTADATYKATFTKQAKSFWVTFYDWDGETIIERQRVKRGEAAKLPEPPVHEGYVFVEWEVDRGDLQKVTTTIKATAVYVEAQGLNDVEDGNRARKIMRDGQILIIRNGKTYTMQGQIVE
ncbi:MAG: starch-binding protein, partial [Paludibacteraceae bacterium]|nr:starch-binding protein [Paludibacteraceae bacterium]